MSRPAYLASHVQHPWARPEIIETPIDHHAPSTHNLPSLDYVTAGVKTLEPFASLEHLWPSQPHHHQHHEISSYTLRGSHWFEHDQLIHERTYGHWQSPRLLSQPTDSAYSSDCSSERHMSTFGSPQLHTLSYSSLPTCGDHILGSTGTCDFEHDHAYAGAQYITPGDMQLYVDAQPEEAAHGDNPWYPDYTHQPEEGFTPIQAPIDHQIPHTSILHSAQTPPASLPPPRSPVVRRIKRESLRDSTHRDRPATARRRSIVSRAPTFSMNRSNVPTPRPFPCPLAPYGCPSSFTAKNEWKRHVYKQHLRTAIWRCTFCPDNSTKGHNEFNRKDLFVQHVRRMHTLKASSKVTTSSKKRTPVKSIKHETTDIDLDILADQCCLALRGLPENTCCLFCDRVFEGPGSFEDRLEHVGTHLEGVKRGSTAIVAVEDWRRDQGMEDWLCATRLGVQSAGAVRLADDGR